jgi:hypothetical protein
MQTVAYPGQRQDVAVAKQCQRFSGDVVDRWKQTLSIPAQKGKQDKVDADQTVVAFQGIVNATHIDEQLKFLTKMKERLKQLLATSQDVPSDVACCVEVLVGMHSLCMSRHPLQRAIARLLDSLSCKDVVLSVMLTRMQEVLEEGKSLDLTPPSLVPITSYFESLMENFTVGRLCLKGSVLEVLSLFHSWIPSLFDASRCKRDSSSLVLASKTLLLVVSRHMEDIRELCGTNKAAMSEVSEADRSSRKDLLTGLKELVQLMLDVLRDPLLSSSSDLTLTCCMLYCELLKVVCSEEGELETSLYGMLADDSKGQAAFYCILSDGAKISFLQGMLSKLPHNVLLQPVEVEGEDAKRCLHWVVFNHLYRLFGIIAKPNLLYKESKALAQWLKVSVTMCESKEILSQTALCRELKGDTGHITSQLLYYIWNQWESPIEGVRHQVREAFSSILVLHKQLFYSDGIHDSFVSSLVNKVVSLDPLSKVRYTYATVLLEHTGVSSFLGVRTNLPLELMEAMSHQVLAPHAAEFWSKALVQHSLEVKDSEWRRTWIHPLLDALCDGDPVQKRFLAQYCVNQAKMPSGSLQYMIEKLGLHEQASNESVLLAELVCLKALTASGKLNDTHTEVIGKAIKSASNEIKVTGFRLLCENKQTTDPPGERTLELVLSFLPDNMSSQSPAFRQQIQTSLKHLMRQVIESGLAMLRKSGPDSPKLLQLKDFLHKFVLLQFSYLNPLVSFQRRSFALSNLNVLSKVLQFVKSDRCRVSSVVDSFYDIYEDIGSSPPLRTALLHSLQDSFPQNRETALILMLELPGQYDIIEDLSTHVAWCYKLSCSPKAVDCTAAAYNWKLLVRRHPSSLPSLLETLNTELKTKFVNLVRELKKKEIYDDLGDFSPFPSDVILSSSNIRPPTTEEETSDPSNRPGASSSSDTRSELRTVLALLDTLFLHRSLAAHSLTLASMQAPMYGVIEAILATLQGLNGSINSSPEAKSLYSAIVKECLLISELCCPVVCNSSPEGFLPRLSAKSKYEESLAERRESGSGLDGDGGATGQSLLLCCWHSMKEISLLFGFLTENLLKRDKTQKHLISMAELGQIGDFFTMLLGQARHRGALEMGYTGFEQFCSCVWSLPYDPTSLLDCTTPRQWIDTKLCSLQDTSSKSITRRSAGLPYYFQGILTSAPPTQTHTLLQHVMTSLMKTVRESKLDTIYSTPAQCPHDNLPPSVLVPEPAAVHALNITRALVRDAKLGESILPFVEELFIIAVDGISSQHWAIRNSSTMLFTALNGRMFGVKTVKDEHKKENKVQSKKFFSQYPNLRPFLLKKLEGVVDSMKNFQSADVDPTVFPVLLTLSRLSPSALDDDNSTTSLSCFIPLVIQCSVSPMWKVRAIAARTLVAIAPCNGISSTPPKNTHTDDTPPKDAPTGEIPPKDMTSEDTPPKDTPPKDMTTEDTPPKDMTTEDTLPKDTPTKDTPPKDAPQGGPLTKDMPPKDTSHDDAPSKGTPTEDTSPEDTPPKDTPTEDTTKDLNSTPPNNSPPTSTVHTVLSLLPSAPRCDVSQNSLHGYILILKEYVNQMVNEHSEGASIYTDATQLLLSLLPFQWIGMRDNVCPVTRLEYLQTLLPLVQCVCEDVNSRRDGCLGVALLTFVKRTMSDVIAALQDGLCSQWLLADIIVGQTVLIVIVIESHSEMLGDLKQLLANIQQSGELGTQILLRASTANKCQSVVNSLVWECIPKSIRNADQATICTCLDIVSQSLGKHSANPPITSDKLKSILDDAVHLGQRDHIRFEVCRSVLAFLAAFGRYVKLKDLALTCDEVSAVMSVLKKVLFEDQVEELCLLSAQVLDSYWTHCVIPPGCEPVRKEIQADILCQFWHLLLHVLFSSFQPVRDEAAECVAKMNDFFSDQFDSSKFLIKDFLLPFFPNIVRTVAVCIAQSFTSCPTQGFAFLQAELKDLRKQLPSLPSLPESPSPLFEEGPVNDYREVLVVGGLLCEGILVLCSSHHELKEDAVKLCKEAQSRLLLATATGFSSPNLRSKSKEFYSVIFTQFIDTRLLLLMQNAELNDSSITPLEPDLLPSHITSSPLFKTFL